MPAQLLPAVLAGVAGGILLQDASAGATSLLPALAIAGGALVALSRFGARTRLAGVAGLVALGVALGAWRGAATALPLSAGSLASYIGVGDQTISGTLVEEPRPRGTRQQVILDAVSLAGASHPPVDVPGRLLVWLPRSVAAGVGDRIRFRSELDEPRDFDGFAYREYLARQGISAVASARIAEVADHRLGPIPEAIARLRRSLLGGLQALVPEPEAALAAGILLGVRASIAPEVSEAFTTAGLTHVVAISGWNIAIVAALVAAATRPLARRPGGRWAGMVLAAVAVGGYVLLTGSSPSVVRAALMAGALVLARLGGSRAHALSALMLAALVMLLVAPPVLWDVGFQLSALATAGLILFGAGIEWRLRRWPSLVREPVALTLAAQLTTLPVILLNFERLSLVAPVANVLVVPIVPIVMLSAALAAAVGALQAVMPLGLMGDVLAWAAGGAAWLYLWLMIHVGQLAARVPFASLDLAAPVWLACAWYPLLPLIGRRLRVPGDPDADRHASGHAEVSVATGLLRPAPLAGVTLLLVAGLTLLTQPDGRLHLAMLDIGQGDSILVRAPSGATLLVDGGPDPELAMRRLGEELPFWQRRIDVVLLTHPHEDHVAGLVPALERFGVGMVLDSGRAYANPTYARFLLDAAAEPDAQLVEVRAGMRIPLDAATSLRILYPTDADVAAPLPDGDINNASVVGLLESGGVRILLTGDAEAPVEQRLLARGLVGRVDVLKVGHHGSDSSTTPAFLAAARPRIALISAGLDNDYGHPHQVTLDKLAAVPGLVVHRTDLEGTVHLDWGAAGRAPLGASSIATWPFPALPRPSGSCATRSCRSPSCVIRVAWLAWRAQRRSSSRPAASRWTWGWSRPPPCSMTSTRWRREAARRSTGSWRAVG